MQHFRRHAGRFVAGLSLFAGTALLVPATSQAASGPVGGATTTTVVQPPGRAATPLKAATPVAGPLDDLTAKAKSAFGADYGGVARVGGASVVYVRAANPKLGVPGVPAGSPNVFDGASMQPVTYSETELTAFKLRLDSSAVSLTKSGIVAWGVDPSKNTVEVMVAPDASVPAAQTTVTAAVQSVPLVGSRKVPVSIITAPGTPKLASRTADYPPIHGGAYISQPAGSCTSGLPWVNAQGYGVMTTAGHCDYPYTGAHWTTGAGSYGTTIFNALNNGGSNHVDTAVINPNCCRGVGPYFYVGPPNGNGLVIVSSYFPSEQNGTYGLRTSGAVSGEQYSGGGNVLATNLAIDFGSPLGVIYGLNYAECITNFGDSGGPVFGIGAGASIIAAGTITGFFDNDPGHCLYTPVNRIIAQYGGAPY